MAALLALVAAGSLFAGWLLVKRPLEVIAWVARRSLGRAGLKKVVVQSLVGPQTAFVGGSGPVLVLLHGAGDQAGTWFRVAPSLARRYTLVIPDLAGHGESAPSNGPIPFSDVLAGLEAVLADQVGGGRVTVVGNSLGAWLAMVFAARQPERVDRVVAVNGGALMGSGGGPSLLPKTREEARDTMARLRDASSPRIPNRVLDDVVRRGATSPIARLAAAAAGMAPFLLGEDQLRDMKLPVRLVWGVSDQLMTLDYARRMAAVLPDVELIPVERCGHVPQQEAPKRFTAALLQALGDAPALPQSPASGAIPKGNPT
ncbi:MAG: alpha/beta fold hydrolase [Thermoanaerobaculia bacterium]